MSTVQISRTHNLDHDECRSVAEDLLDKLVDKYGGSVRSQGDGYCYRHATGMSAIVEPREGELDITIKFNMMTRSFAPAVEAQIHRVLDEHMGADT